MKFVSSDGNKQYRLTDLNRGPKVCDADSRICDKDLQIYGKGSPVCDR